MALQGSNRSFQTHEPEIAFHFLANQIISRTLKSQANSERQILSKPRNLKIGHHYFEILEIYDNGKEP
jgi:hypothetical protein